MNSYLLFKSLHLIAVISWMAGLLYLPRIFVYHVENKDKKEATDIFEVMERRLFYYIMRPAMIFTWVFGLVLIYLHNHGASDLLEIKLPSSNATVLLPFTNAAVPTVDLKLGRIVADPPLGIFPEQE